MVVALQWDLPYRIILCPHSMFIALQFEYHYKVDTQTDNIYSAPHVCHDVLTS